MSNTPSPDSAVSRASLPGLLAKELRAELTPRLEKLFGGCDDALFDMASRARSNAEQSLYFESLREIRGRRLAVGEDFLRRVADPLFTLSQHQPAEHSEAWAESANPGADSLELIGHDEMEKRVVVTDIVKRARQDGQEALFQIGERLGVLAGRALAPHAMPLDPLRITLAFIRATDPLDVPMEVRKLAYQQFDLHLVRRLEELYELMNRHLREAGVLPELAPLRKQLRKEESRPARPAPPAPATAGAASQGPAAAAGQIAAPGEITTGSFSAQETFGIIPGSEAAMQELAEVLGALRSRGVKLPMLVDLSSTVEGEHPIRREELVGLLTEVQLQSASIAEGDPEPLDIRQAIHAIVASRGNLSLAQPDEDTVNVIAMFFDLILEDRNLPLEIKALVSRLQLPILKVALKDKTFFSNRKHPARQLLNEIARTSIGWDASDKDMQDALFIRLTELVEEVLRASADDTAVFDKCLADLLGFIERSESRATRTERRTTERAQAEARTARARELTRQTLHDRLEGKRLRAELTEFLVEDWQQVMQLVYLRNGPESAEWLDTAQAVDDLLWTAQSHADERSRARRDRLLPELRARVEAGIELSRGNADEAQARVAELWSVYAPESSETAAPPAELTPEQSERIRPEPGDERSWREMTAVERQKVQHEALMFEFLRRAEEIPIGTWFEYDDLRRAVTMRCKLAARIEESGIFVFVSRTGVLLQ
ncbi:MAG: DUF1631 family protein, partial [Gammaproteobacteria bacterium]